VRPRRAGRSPVGDMHCIVSRREEHRQEKRPRWATTAGPERLALRGNKHKGSDVREHGLLLQLQRPRHPQLPLPWTSLAARPPARGGAVDKGPEESCLSFNSCERPDVQFLVDTFLHLH
jgi:hypothetical protein